MIGKKISMSCIAAALAMTTSTQAVANDIVGGIVGGIIGGAIVNEANRNRQRTVVRRSTVPSATRAANREVQTSLNYFGFPAGTPDGVLGRNSRNAISQYQAYMNFPVTGQLAPFERDFLVTSYQRAQAGGILTSQQVAQNPQGVRGLLIAYRDQQFGQPAQPQFAQPAPQPVQPAPQTTVVAVPETPVPAAPAATLATSGGAVAGSALPNFLGGDTEQASLASHCNKVSLLTNTNGGFVTAANMTDPNHALNEQFCLARTYAITQGEDMAARLQGVTPQQIVEQCQGFGPAMRDHVAAVSLKTSDEVLQGVSGFILNSGMSPAQLTGTARICLSAGYRTDNMDVAIGSALLLVALGERVYGELLGHHLAQGFGTSRRPDLGLAWYDMSLDALDQGAPAVFNPGQPERADLIRRAAYNVGGRAEQAIEVPVPAALPSFVIEKEASK